MERTSKAERASPSRRHAAPRRPGAPEARHPAPLAISTSPFVQRQRAQFQEMFGPAADLDRASSPAGREAGPRFLPAPIPPPHMEAGAVQRVWNRELSEKDSALELYRNTETGELCQVFDRPADGFVLARILRNTPASAAADEGHSTGPIVLLSLDDAGVGHSIDLAGQEAPESGASSSSESSPVGPTATEQSDQQLIDRGFRLARLTTSFLAQVELAPLATTGPSSSGHSFYSPGQIVATAVSVSDADRPATYLEPRKDSSGGIPQGKHTVAWAFLRRWFSSFAGKTVEWIIATLYGALSREEEFVRVSPEGQFLLKQIQVPLAEFLKAPPLRIDYWNRVVSDLIRLYAQIHHLSASATVTGRSKFRDESGGIAALLRAETLLAESPAANVATLVAGAADKLIEVSQSMPPDVYAAAVFHWILLLGDVYPRVMHAVGPDVIGHVLSKPLGQTYRQEVPGSAPTVADLLGHFGYTIPGFTAPSQPAQLPSSRAIPTADFESALDDFVANVEVTPADGGTGGAEGSFSITELETGRIRISDKDRPDTQFGSAQQSHTVAWTLIRAELTSMSERPLVELCSMLLAEFHSLAEEGGGRTDVVSRALDAIQRLRKSDFNAPLYMWQAEISRLVAWYFHAHQAAPSTTYYDPRTSQASSHGEPAHMAVLRRTELILSNRRQTGDDNRPQPVDTAGIDVARVVEAAVKLLDVYTDMGPSTAERAPRAAHRWLRAMGRTFPEIMREFQHQIVEAARVAYFAAPSQPAAFPPAPHAAGSLPTPEDLTHPHTAQSGEAAGQLTVLPERGVPSIVEYSVWSELRQQGFTGTVLVVDGTNWTCYIRCVLHRLGRMADYDAVIADLVSQRLDLSNGVTVGAEHELPFQQTIERVTGLRFHVSAMDVSHGHTAASQVQEGTQVRLILTGVHFSLLLE